MTGRTLRDARGPILVASGVVALLLGAALQAYSLRDDPTMPAALPPPPPVPLTASDPSEAERLGAAGIALTQGWQPSGIIAAVDAWDVVDPVSGVRAWIDRLPRVRIAYDDAGRLLVEDAVVIADPAHCYHLARTVRRVGVGVPPPVGPHVAAQLEAWLEPPYFSGVRSPVGRGPCAGPDRTQWGFAIEQAEPLDACVVPAREVICFTLAKWRYDFGARDTWTSTHRVFDVTTGERLDDSELHPGIDVAAFDALVDHAVCTLGGRCDGVPPREGRIHPTRRALIVELSPGEAAEEDRGSLRLTVDRRIIPLITDVPRTSQEQR